MISAKDWDRAPRTRNCPALPPKSTRPAFSLSESYKAWIMWSRTIAADFGVRVPICPLPQLFETVFGKHFLCKAVNTVVAELLHQCLCQQVQQLNSKQKQHLDHWHCCLECLLLMKTY